MHHIIQWTELHHPAAMDDALATQKQTLKFFQPCCIAPPMHRLHLLHARAALRAFLLE
jgi:hypothetical protein